MSINKDYFNKQFLTARVQIKTMGAAEKFFTSVAKHPKGYVGGAAAFTGLIISNNRHQGTKLSQQSNKPCGSNGLRPQSKSAMGGIAYLQ